MRKFEEFNFPTSTFNKANKNEMLFILRAQDITSPKTIVAWIAENIDTAPDEKLIEALECALEMRRHNDRKSAD